MPLHSVGLVIASVDEIPWGHVGIMRDRKNVIEACPGGVRIVNISDYAKNVEYVNHIDVFRPISADGNGFDKDSIKRMRAFLDQCIGVQFPVLTMFPLYFIQKMRMQISSSSLRNAYLSFASALLKFSKEGAMCSEFVTQALRKLEPNDRNWPRLLDRCPELLSGGLTLSNRDFIQGAT